MAPRVFILGISGYVGGQFLSDLTREHPDYQIAGLVRNEDQAQQIKAKFPLTETVIGDLESSKILYQEAQKADVVVQAANCDHLGCLEPLISGMAKGNKSGAYIQISGAGSILDRSPGLGQASTRIYDDLADFDEISTLDATHLHAEVDQAVQKLGKQYGVKTALLLPVHINGVGEGPIKTRTIQLVLLQAEIAKRGKAFVVGEGKAICASIDIKDLSAAMITFVDEALKPKGGKAIWGDKGIYYLESEEYGFINITMVMAKAMRERGLIETTEIEHISPEEAQTFHPYAALLWGTNMRCKGSRIRRTIGWEPKQPSVFNLVQELKA